MYIRKGRSYDGIRYDYYIDYKNEEGRTLFTTFCPSKSHQNILYNLLLEYNYYEIVEKEEVN